MNLFKNNIWVEEDFKDWNIHWMFYWYNTKPGKSHEATAKHQSEEQRDINQIKYNMHNKTLDNASKFGN